MSDRGEAKVGQPEDTPTLRVVRGEPTAEELAALVAVFTAVAVSRPGSGPRQDRTGWSDRASSLGAPVYPGPGAWRASALPR
ncbi:MAG TPA: acyl-CoA carboxylase subunit epsilon [Mycobacteriales bacterium]